MPRYPLFVAGKNAEGKVIYYDLLQYVFLLHFRVPWGDLPQASRDSAKEKSGCGPVLSFEVPCSSGL